jgi:hypothetical protein
MKMTLSTLLFVSVSLCYAEKKPVTSEENLAKLQAVKTVFVDGNSESADKLREKMESWTCLKLTNNKAQADAIMSVEEREKPSDLHKAGRVRGHHDAERRSGVDTNQDGRGRCAFWRWDGRRESVA